MASTPVVIADTLEALRTGEIPGAFNADRTVFTFPTLRYENSFGKPMLWTISVRLLRGGAPAPATDAMLSPGAALSPDFTAEVSVRSQQEGGKVRPTKPTVVRTGKNLGKKNATNPLTQALRDALSFYNRQRRHTGHGLKESAPGAGRGRAAARDEAGADLAPPPMLVKVLGASRDATLTAEDFAAGVTVQPKLNGVHFVAHASARGPGAALVTYSRTSSAYPGQRQLAAELLPMLGAAPPVRAGTFGVPLDAPETVRSAYAGALPYLDGELYLHGRSLNWISGQARKDEDEGLLEFHVFDVFFPAAVAAGHNMPSWARQAYLDALFEAAPAPHPHVSRVRNFPAASLDEVRALAAKFVQSGYEGAVARKNAGGYRYSYNNYHSAALLKVKPKFDDEFPVVGFTQGSRGKDVGAVVWVCEVPKAADPRDRTFNVVPKDMTYAQRYALYRCLSAEVPDPRDPSRKVTRFARDLQGLPLTVEYAELSAKTGKPLQAKALTFRTYEGGPESDPVRKLFLECGLAT